MTSHRRWIPVLVILALTLPAWAEEGDGEAKDRFRFHGEVRVRGEVQGNYSTFNDNSGVLIPDVVLIPDDTISFPSFRVRAGMEADITDNLTGMVEIQVAQVASVDDEQRDVLFSNIDPFDLYQAYMHWNKIGGSKSSLRIGRQELVLGNGFLMSNEPYYNGISFDALRYYWGDDHFHAQFWWSTTNETFDDDADTDLFTFELGGAKEKGPAISFYTMFERNDEISSVGRQDLLVFGFRWTRLQADASHFLWNLELAWEDGRVHNDPNQQGKDSFIAAWGMEATFGYNWNTGSSNQQFYLHLYAGSGDSNGSDDENNGFQTLYQGTHDRLGKMDLVQGTNVVSAGLAYVGTYAERHEFGVDLMTFLIADPEGAETQLAAPAGNFQSGVGFTIPPTGISGVPGINPDADDLGQELDLWYDYYYSDNLSFELLLGTFLPGEAISQINLDGMGNQLDDPAFRIAGQARLRF